jgi:hypothetical protein
MLPPSSGSKILRNFGILLQQAADPPKSWYPTTSTGITDLQNFGNLAHQKRHGPLKRRYPTTTLDDVRTQKATT